MNKPFISRVTQSGLTEGLTNLARLKANSSAMDSGDEEEKDNLLSKRESSHDYDWKFMHDCTLGIRVFKGTTIFALWNQQLHFNVIVILMKCKTFALNNLTNLMYVKSSKQFEHTTR